MIEGILTSTHIKRVAIRQKWFSTHTFYEIHDGLCIIRTQISQIPRFSKMNLDCCIFLIKINRIHSGRLHQAHQLLLYIFLQSRTEICKINFRFFHYLLSYSFYCLTPSILIRLEKAVNPFLLDFIHGKCYYYSCMKRNL